MATVCSGGGGVSNRPEGAIDIMRGVPARRIVACVPRDSSCAREPSRPFFVSNLVSPMVMMDHESGEWNQTPCMEPVGPDPVHGTGWARHRGTSRILYGCRHKIDKDLPDYVAWMMFCWTFVLCNLLYNYIDRLWNLTPSKKKPSCSVVKIFGWEFKLYYNNDDLKHAKVIMTGSGWASRNESEAQDWQATYLGGLRKY